MLASLAAWTGLIGFCTLTSKLFGRKKAPATPPAAAAAPSAPAASSGGFAMPTADNIGEWAEKESNWEALEKQLK